MTDFTIYLIEKSFVNGYISEMWALEPYTKFRQEIQIGSVTCPYSASSVFVNMVQYIAAILSPRGYVIPFQLKLV